ncbi:holin [Paenibacillus rhizolycopersici]|uniref:holin n=1 Tax=Paenibacillus rhizolycopersici TaxID=2780073 RepID=UPI003D2D6A06
MTIAWLKAAAIRAIKTAAQTAIGVIGATTVFTEVDWRIVGGTVLLATITSFLTSLAGLPEVGEGK